MERIEVPAVWLKSATVGYIIGSEVHILRCSSSCYGLIVNDDLVGQYCCQDGCCDAGLHKDVEQVVRRAAEKGATAVVLRTGQGRHRFSRIAGLPVKDVKNYYGKELQEDARVTTLRAYFNQRAR